MSFLTRLAKSYAPITAGNYSSIASPGAPSMEVPNVQPFGEGGVTGLLRTKGTGYVYEEWLAQLSTYRQRQVYREMRDNDPTIGSMFFAIEMLLRGVQWYVEPQQADAKSEQYAEFVEGCMDDMSGPWMDFIAECTNMFAFGFSLFETVYKPRRGQQPGTFTNQNGFKERRSTSKYDDGLIGWRKMAPRAQESILYWIWDDAGGLQGAVQLAAPDFRTVAMPIEKLLLLRTTSIKNSPEGRSCLRNAFRPWTFKKRLEEVEGIGIERDLCGMPVIFATTEGMKAAGGMQALRNIVRNIRIDDQMGVVFPVAYDDKGNPHIKLELLKAAGPKGTDPDKAIARYDSQILACCLANFIQIGTKSDAGGSRALHMSAAQIFARAIGAFLVSIADVFNRIAIPRLMALNKMDLSKAPKLRPGEIDIRDLDEMATYILNLSQAGLSFNDPATASYLRKVAKLPDQPSQDTTEQEEVPTGDDARDSETPGKPAPAKQPPAAGKPAVPGKPSSQPTQTPGQRQQSQDRLEGAV